MIKIKYDINLMKYISLFDSLTRAKVKDCFELGEKLVFVVQPGEIGKALGKKAANVKRIENVLKKKIRVIEFDPDLIEFIKNVIYPINAKNIEQKEKVIIITSPDTQARGLLIGKSAEILRNNEKVVKRYFDIEEIKII